MVIREWVWLVSQVLETLDAVLDVGGVYDPSNDRYDHHQKGFAEVFGHGFNTKLSSAGLVYKVMFFFLMLCLISCKKYCKNRGLELIIVIILL